MHWYSLQGQPVYEVAKKDGSGTRPTTLADAKKNKYVPGSTGVIAIPAKPGVDRWKYKRLLGILEQHKTIILNREEGWEDKLLGIHKDHMDTSMKKGTDIHNALEAIYTEGFINNEDPLHRFVEPSVNFIERTFPEIQWCPEKSFAHKLGYGGKVDLHSMCGNYIIDFKTKDNDDLTKIELYDDYPMQLASYRLGLGLERARCYNLFISSTKKQEPILKEWTEKELERGLKMFINLLEYWKLKNNYESGYDD